MKSIGIKLADGSFYPVMKEGSSEKTTLELTTVQDNQTTVQIDLYRSETDSMQDAEYVDSLEINLNPHPNGEPSLKLDLNLDDAGELHAEVNDPETGTSSAKQVTLISRSEEERQEPANFTVESSHSDFVAPPPSDDDFSFDSINETSGILPPLEPIGDIFADEETQTEQPANFAEESDDFFAENPPAELTQMFADVKLPDLPEDIFADEENEEASADNFTDATDDFLSDEEFPIFEEQDAQNEDNFSLPDVSQIMEDDSAEGVETDSTHIEDGTDDIITAQEVSSEPEEVSSTEDFDESFDTDFPTETPSENFTESSAELGVEKETETLEENPAPKEEESFEASEIIEEDSNETEAEEFESESEENENPIQDDSIDVTNEFFDASDEFSDTDEQFPIFEELDDNAAGTAGAEKTEVQEEPQFDLPDISELMNDEPVLEEPSENADEPFTENFSEAENDTSREEDFSLDALPNFEQDDLSFDVPDFSFSSKEKTDSGTEDFSQNKDAFSNDSFDFDLPDENSQDESESDFYSTFEFPDFDDSPAFTDTESYSPQSSMFADLYDAETLNGNSAQNEKQESYEEEKKSHTLAPVVICVVCAVICVLAALMVLFVIPSRLNILGKNEILVTQNSSETQNALNENDIELPPPDTSLPDAPKAQEDKIVVAHTPSTLVPEQPVRAQKEPEVIRYKIVWGDTLWDIANAYYKNPWRYKALAEYNHIANPDYIQAGRIIEIPAE